MTMLFMKWMRRTLQVNPENTRNSLTVSKKKKKEDQQTAAFCFLQKYCSAALCHQYCRISPFHQRINLQRRYRCTRSVREIVSRMPNIVCARLYNTHIIAQTIVTSASIPLMQALKHTGNANHTGGVCAFRKIIQKNNGFISLDRVIHRYNRLQHRESNVKPMHTRTGRLVLLLYTRVLYNI